MINSIVEIDKNLMVFLNKTSSNPIFDILMPIITNQKFLTIIGVILILYLGFYAGKRGKITLIILIFAAGISDAVCAQIIKPWVGRIRPSHEFIEYINLLNLIFFDFSIAYFKFETDNSPHPSNFSILL